MAVPVMIGLLIGLAVGGTCMAVWAAARIGEEAARQFDRGFERGRWLADLTVARALEPPRRTHARPLACGGELTRGHDPDPPRSLLLLP